MELVHARARRRLKRGITAKGKVLKKKVRARPTAWQCSVVLALPQSCPPASGCLLQRCLQRCLLCCL